MMSDYNTGQWSNSDVGAAFRETDRRIMRLEEINADLLEALKEIAKGEGAFSMDSQIFANNTIENMQKIAHAAIAKATAID